MWRVNAKVKLDVIKGFSLRDWYWLYSPSCILEQFISCTHFFLSHAPMLTASNAGMKLCSIVLTNLSNVKKKKGRTRKQCKSVRRHCLQPSNNKAVDKHFLNMRSWMLSVVKKNASGWHRCLTCIYVSTSFWGVDTETLVPEAAHQNVAIVRCYHETLRVDLDALVHQIRDLPLVRPCVVGWDIAKT